MHASGRMRPPTLYCGSAGGMPSVVTVVLSSLELDARLRAGPALAPPAASGGRTPSQPQPLRLAAALVAGEQPASAWVLPPSSRRARFTLGAALRRMSSCAEGTPSPLGDSQPGSTAVICVIRHFSTL